ncbi:MAG: peptidylprolyl isomerase, partial [Planctomycetes bacterium]|nr:peptidylprolyl isomerase [Planctomycetota bacterium]
RALAATNPVPCSTVMVNGEEITVDDIMATPTRFRTASGGSAALGDVLSPVARANPQGRFTELARPQVKSVVENKVSEAILLQLARTGAQSDKLEDALAAAEEQEWRKFVIQHEGDEAKADETLRAQGMTRDQYKALQKRSILSQVHIRAQTSSKRPITHLELVDYYAKMKDERFVILPKIQFKLIEIGVDKLEGLDPGSDPLEEARRLANDIAQKLHAGADFATLARTHSHGLFEEQGGQWPERSPDSFVAPYDRLIEAAASASEGDIVGPVEVPGRFFVMKLDRRQQKGYRPLADVQGAIENEIRKDRYAVAVEKLTADIAAHAAAGPMGEYIDRCMEEAYRMYNEK